MKELKAKADCSYRMFVQHFGVKMRKSKYVFISDAKLNTLKRPWEKFEWREFWKHSYF